MPGTEDVSLHYVEHAQHFSRLLFVPDAERAARWLPTGDEDLVSARFPTRKGGARSNFIGTAQSHDLSITARR